MCGFRKDGFYFYQSQWTDKPCCTCSRTGTGRGDNSSPSPATPIVTRELFLNGRSVGVKGYAFPRQGRGQVRELPRASPGASDDSRLAPGVGCAVRTGTLKAVGTKDGSGGHGRGFDSGRAGHDRPRGGRDAIAADRRDVAHITGSKFRTRPAGWRPRRPTRWRSSSKAKGRSSGSTTATPIATRVTNRRAGRHSTDCAWPSCNRPANRPDPSDGCVARTEIRERHGYDEGVNRRHNRLRNRSLKSREKIARKRAMGKLKHAPPWWGML